MKRLVPAMVAVALMLLVSSSADAATAPRLVGKWTVKSTITKSVNASSNPLGHVYTGQWTFTPKCATGGCATTLKRPRYSDGTLVTYTMNPTMATQYRGTRAYTAPCFANNGSVLVQNGYTNTEVVTINVTKSAKGVVTAFGGTLVAKFKPTPAGQAKNCVPGEVDAKLQSVKRIS
ncbi:MAG: hypothetical protein JO291_12435 [Acidimicrobiia bacterium]|nr:hypothetical protein [Acidimicrobiia bacterium]